MPKVVSANAFLCGKLHDQLHVWKIKLKTTAKQPSVFCGYFFSLIHVNKFLYNVNENGRNYEEKNEGGNESAVDGPQRNKEKAGKRNDGLCLKRGSKRACSRKFKLIDEKIKEGCLGTTGERESTKCCRSNSNSKSCCIADLKYNSALLLLDTPSHWRLRFR